MPGDPVSTNTDRNGAPMPVPNDGPSMHDLACGDLQRRKALGLARYGAPLQAFNGRDALNDLYEELMDALVYLRQAIEERNALQAGGDDLAEEVARQVIDAKRRRLLLHLKQEHRMDTVAANHLFYNSNLIQAHLDEHRLRADELAHGYQPWGDQ